MVKKVAWFDASEFEKEFLENVDTGLDIEFFDQPLDSDTVSKAEGFDAVTVFIDSEVDSDVISELDAELVACRSTGFDHVDTESASDRGIAVCNVPNYSANTVAEHTFALLLAISRKLYDAINKVKEGSFSHEGLRGFDLQGKTFGVIGTGSIGRHAIRIAKGFGMDVKGFDPYPDEEKADELGFDYVSLEELLKVSDVVSLHCPLTDENEHLLSEEEFELMDETVIINTARGKLIDTEALIKALENGDVMAAGLDVLEDECYMSDDINYLGDVGEKCDLQVILEDHILMGRDDVVVTPHNAFNSDEALGRLVKTTLGNLKECTNRVN